MLRPDYGDAIPDRDFLEAIDGLTQPTGDEPRIWTTTWELVDVFGASDEIVHAKAKDMLDRELIYGCACGCRGDWSLDDAGLYERPSIDELLGRAA
jgi:hypothetical protein